MGGMTHAAPHLHKQFLPTHLPPQMFHPKQPHQWTSAPSAGSAKIGINRPKSASLGGKSMTCTGFTGRSLPQHCLQSGADITAKTDWQISSQ